MSVFKVLFAFSVVLFWGDLKEANGLDSGLWVWGTMLYLTVLLTVLGKAALVSEYVFHNIVLPPRLIGSLQPLDEVHGSRYANLWRTDITVANIPRSYPWIIHLHDAVPATVRRCGPRHWILQRIPEYCPSTVG